MTSKSKLGSFYLMFTEQDVCGAHTHKKQIETTAIRGFRTFVLFCTFATDYTKYGQENSWDIFVDYAD